MGVLGWITGIGFGIALLNYILKYVNKNYIVKLDKSKLTEKQNKFISYYREVMKLVVKNHKLVGIVTTVALISHVALSIIIKKRISITGLVAGGLMLLMVTLGVYGVYINKDYKGKWLKYHRTIAFLLIVAIIAHGLFKAKIRI